MCIVLLEIFPLSTGDSFLCEWKMKSKLRNIDLNPRVKVSVFSSNGKSNSFKYEQMLQHRAFIVSSHTFGMWNKLAWVNVMANGLIYGF